MIEFLYDAFISPLSEPFFIKSLIGGSVAAIVCSVVGCLVILRKMAFLGDALSHAMIAGVAGGYLFMKILFDAEAHAPAMLIGSIIAAIVTVALISFVSNISRIKEDTAIGIIYTGIFAAGVVLVSVFSNHIHIDLLHFIMGDVLGVADSDLWVSVIAASIVLSLIVLFFRYFHITSFDPIMAASIGIPVILIDYTLTASVSLVVVSAVSMVGVILVVGLLITPAATAYLLSDRLEKMMLLSAVFGVSSVVGGLYLCIWVNSSGGGAIMLFCTLQFLVVLFVAPKYGILSNWLRKRRIVPQQVIEDILGSVQRSSGKMQASDLAMYVEASKKLVSKAIRRMQSEQLLICEGSALMLTDQGEKEASRLLRAHRLWETYLHRSGVKKEKVHSIAHELEHLNDPPSVHYIDDILGHPSQDPHGSNIPEELDSITPGSVVALSLIRKGSKGIIESVGTVKASGGLKKGDHITMAQRRDSGRTWVVKKGNKDILLNHAQADEITVKIEK